MRHIFVTADPYPTSDAVRAEAAALGATEIAHGTTPALQRIGVQSLGYHELPDPEPAPVVDRRGELLAILDQSPLMLDELHEVLTAVLTEGLI